MKLFSFALLTVFLLSGCIKNGSTTPACSPVTTTAPASEVATLQAYLDSNHIAASQDSRGFFYNIDSSASTVPGHPTVCSAFSAIYTGSLTNGHIFDSSGVATPFSSILSQHNFRLAGGGSIDENQFFYAPLSATWFGLRINGYQR